LADLDQQRDLDERDRDEDEKQNGAYRTVHFIKLSRLGAPAPRIGAYWRGFRAPTLDPARHIPLCLEATLPRFWTERS
jgi:hypothetical protein